MDKSSSGLPEAGSKGMTVKDAIKFLSKLPDKEIALMIDCPNCGRGNQLASIVECVVLRSEVER